MLKLGDTKPEVFSLQKKLFSLGLYSGNFSGTFDEDTLNAVKKYQTDKFVTGVMSDPLLKILESDVLKKSNSDNISSTLRKSLMIKLGRNSDLAMWRSRNNFPVELIIIESSNSVFTNNTEDFHSYHFRIDRSGEIRSFVDLDKAAIHSSGYCFNLKGDILDHINERSFCIQLDNLGQLFYDKGKYFYNKELNKQYDTESFGNPITVDGLYYQPFTYEQIKSTIKLIRELDKHFKIRAVCFKNELNKEDSHCISPALPRGKFDYEYNALPINTSISN